MVQVLDDSVTTIDMGLRQRLKNPSADPCDWWDAKIMKKVTRPVMGQSLHLAHMMPGRVNPKTIRKIHDRSVLVTIKALASHNSGVEGEKKMKYKIQETDDDGANLIGGRNYMECKTVYEVVESTLNLMAIVHQVRPYSYEVLALVRCLHAIHFYFGVTEDPKTQKTLLEKFIGEVLAYNQRRGHEKKFPATYKKCLELAKEVTVANGLNPDHLFTKVDPYCGRRLMSHTKKVADLEKEVGDNRFLCS